DPATDGRPDPRPDVRENAPALGDLRADFDFNQASLRPVVLSGRPRPGAGPRRLQLSARGARLQHPLRHGGRVAVRVRCNELCAVNASGRLAASHSGARTLIPRLLVDGNRTTSLVVT